LIIEIIDTIKGEVEMIIPKSVEILEVCPRDGFQNVKDFIATEDKIAIVERLIDANFKRIELGSFVSPKAIPQMADTKEVVAAAKQYAVDQDIKFVALVPNARGVESAIAAGVDQITYVISASESHNKANVNRTVAESMEQYEALIKEYKGDIDFRLGLATTFGCPFGDEVKIERIQEMCKWAFDLGTVEILMADTVGLGNPKKVSEVMRTLVNEFGPEKFVMHLHDTRGLALANTLAAMQYGITKFESATGGLGGCPFAPGASGNAATEDLYYMLSEMGIETNIEIEKVYEAIQLIKDKVNTTIVSHLAPLYKGNVCKDM